MKNSPFSIHNLNPGLVEEVEYAYAKNVEAGRVVDDTFAGDVAVESLASKISKEASRSSMNQLEYSALEAIDNPETLKAFEDMFRIEKALFDRIDIDLPTPDELETTFDFARLAGIYERMKEKGLEPRIVLAPIANDYDFFWRNLYNQLGNDNSNSLSYEGLIINNEIKSLWSELADIPSNQIDAYNNKNFPYYLKRSPSGDSTVWTLRLFPGTNRAPNIPHVSVPFSEQNHPTIEEYLTMQATILQDAGTPVDSIDTNDVHGSTWLSGHFPDSIRTTAAPYGYWDEISHSIKIDYWKVEEDAKGKQTDVREAQW